MKTTPVLSGPALRALEPELPALAEEIVAAIRSEVPEYDRPLRGSFGRGIRAGVEEALRRFGAAGGEPSGVYRALGRGELAAGRSLDALQSAYRVGARVAWRRLSAAAAAAGVAVEEQHTLAEAIFAYIDELAAESVEGYAAAQAALAGDAQRRRERLLVLLTGPVPVGTVELDAAAREAGWPLPRRVAAVAAMIEPSRLAGRLDGAVLHGRLGEAAVALVPEPAGLEAQATAAAARLGVRVAVGPAVALAEARRSADWARRCLALPGDAPVALAEERLADLALLAAPDVLTALRERALAPLAAETPASRARLTQTLAAWLAHHGARAAVAHALGVHPQTVRYRVTRLRQLFGEDLEDPEARFALQLALRSYTGA